MGINFKIEKILEELKNSNYIKCKSNNPCFRYYFDKNNHYSISGTVMIMTRKVCLLEKLMHTSVYLENRDFNKYIKKVPKDKQVVRIILKDNVVSYF